MLKYIYRKPSQFSNRAINTIQLFGSNSQKLAFMLKKMNPRRGKHIFIACMPKSGSTFMVNALAELTGYLYMGFTDGYERNDQNMSYTKLIDAYNINSVTHQHVRGTDLNIELMNKFSIKPVIMVRNIFDIVISIRDHFYNEGFEFPTCYCNKKFLDLDEKTQLDFIIEQGLPWYFNFYMSWLEATKLGKTQTLWITFEEAVKDWKVTLQKVIQFYHIEKTDSQIENALEKNMTKKKKKNRLNKGIVGRGNDMLTSKQKERIMSQSRFYPWVDFSNIGII